MPYWHKYNPWKDDIVYVTLDELMDCIASIGEELTIMKLVALQAWGETILRCEELDSEINVDRSTIDEINRFLSCQDSGIASKWVFRNELLFLQSQLLTAQETLRRLEKDARRTPPKTLKIEWERVNVAKFRSVQLQSQINIMQKHIAELKEVVGTDKL